MESIRDWKWLWLQVLVLALALIAPCICDFASVIKMIFSNNNVDFNNVKYYFLMRLGNGAIGIALMILALLFFRKYNSGHLLNTGILYHKHYYSSYWFCTKILGYKKCCLIRVSNAMQFKLLLSDTFSEYDYGNENDYRCIDDEAITIEAPADNFTSTVNLVLADTYPIATEQIPASISNFSIVHISRDNKNNSVRCFSKVFYESVLNTVRHLPNNVYSINIFATLNPKHSYWIARNVFKMGGRSNILKLSVFTQPHNKGNWNFSETGIKIF